MTCKRDLFGDKKHRMSDEILEKLVSDYLSLQLEASSFAFQGGEPTLMGLDFYKKLVELEKKYGKPGQQISNALQTNAILLDDDWCKFLAEYQFLVGISLDGPKHLHDHYRLDRAGKGTFDRVIKAIDCCKKNKVLYNILTLLNKNNVEQCDEIFDFFVEQGFDYWQFIPCVEADPKTGEIADFSVTPKQYGDFLCRLFDRWMAFGPEKISIRMFDSLLSYSLNARHIICTFARSCNDYLVIEHNGDAFCCDFFVTDKWRCGNIMQTPVAELLNSKIKKDFAKNKRNLENKCLLCRFKAICQGGCPKDRIVLQGRYDQCSYFCESYREFFDYALPRLDQLAARLRSQNS